MEIEEEVEVGWGFHLILVVGASAAFSLLNLLALFNPPLLSFNRFRLLNPPILSLSPLSLSLPSPSLPPSLPPFFFQALPKEPPKFNCLGQKNKQD